MFYNMNNCDIYDIYRMSDQYRHEEEWAEEQHYIQMERERLYKRHCRMKKIKILKVADKQYRKIIVIDIDNDDMPF